MTPEMKRLLLGVAPVDACGLSDEVVTIHGVCNNGGLQLEEQFKVACRRALADGRHDFSKKLIASVKDP